MLLLALVWFLAAIGDGAVFATTSPLTPHLRVWLSGALLAITVVTSVLLMVGDWDLWLVPGVIGLYRVINSLRFMWQRLPERHLSSVALRANTWLVILQVVAVLVASLLVASHSLRVVWPVLATLQLLSALVLLRASLHTWRHTEPFTSPTPLSDKELPALSVLVPARNETDSLQRCLEHLLASNYPKLEILVLDDNSTNRRTPEIIRSFAHEGVRFIQGAEPDEYNWLAKNQAYEQLCHEASGELLLFCGVDALFGPDSLKQLVEVLLGKHKDMLSILPLKDSSVHAQAALLQPMRYYWEICLPRRFFKRPPVLSTCWLIRATTLQRVGGFSAVSRSITPEAYFARQAVVTDAYSFIRSNAELGIYSAKPAEEQYATSVRMRYPQLHKRLELVAVTTFAELLVLVGPIAGLACVALMPKVVAYAAIWIVCIACLLVTYYLVAVETKLNNPWFAWLLMPAAFVNDMLLQHISLYKYEFSHVQWKGRDVIVPVMQVLPRLPHA